MRNILIAFEMTSRLNFKTQTEGLKCELYCVPYTSYAINNFMFHHCLLQKLPIFFNIRRTAVMGFQIKVKTKTSRFTDLQSTPDNSNPR